MYYIGPVAPLASPCVGKNLPSSPMHSWMAIDRVLNPGGRWIHQVRERKGAKLEKSLG